jgi:hypothetical protein
MPRTALSIESAPGSTPLAANTLTMTAADVANGNQFAHTGRELLLVENVGASSHNVTLQSVAVAGRQDPLHNTSQAVPAGEKRLYGPFGDGWRQSGDVVHVNADHAEIKFAVIRY